MVSEYGMSEKVGPLSFGHDDPNAFFGGPSSKMSAHTAEVIDAEVTRLLNRAHDTAERILNDKRDLLRRLSELLLVVETIDGVDLKAYANGTKPIPDPATVQPNGKVTRPATPVTVPSPGGQRGGHPAAPPMPGFQQ
jgi:cell division protease FtsH